MPDLNSPDRSGSLTQSHPPPQSHTKSESMSAASDVNSPTTGEHEESAGLDGAHDRASGDGDAAPAVQNPTGQQSHAQANIDPATAKQVEDVLKSELGIATLLNRLKQSITSAKEFAVFLKKRSSLAEDHAQSLKKLCRMSQESMRRPEHRQGSFAQSYDEMMQIHERMADNSNQFSSSLHQMHDDLLELANTSERSRKMWKTNGLAAEQKVADLEQTMRKSKAKYDSLADEYDRARTGDARQGGKVFGLKGPKSAQQHEEDLLKKVQTADSTYHNHVQTLQSEKASLISTTRPEAIHALTDLIKEIDAGLTLQLQKFAAFNEKLLLSNGMIVSPLKPASGGAPVQPRSLRNIISAIDNDRDLNTFVSYHHTKVQPTTEVKYERHPAMNPQTSAFGQSQPPSGYGHQGSVSQSGPQPGTFSQQPPSASGRPSTAEMGRAGGGMPGSSEQGFPSPGNANTPSFGQPHNRSASQGNMMGQRGGPPPPQQQQQSPQSYGRSPAQPAPRYGNGPSGGSQGAPQLGALAFQGGPPGSHQPGSSFDASEERRGSSGQGPNPSYGAPPPPMGGRGGASSAPAKPVFGVALNRLYERDGFAVPMVVYQCIQAVDLFGLNLEGIYRQSGSVTHISRLKSMFDNDSQNPALDFRNPENFYQDVNSVTGLLKQFFRDLPDPLFTMEHHDSFITAAKQDDDVIRRDSLHAIINSLPDPNYATLRALTFHLHRVMDKSHVNRMNSHNLAVIFGPTLMGTDPSTAIQDAGWQIKVVDTVLQNTYQIFDED